MFINLIYQPNCQPAWEGSYRSPPPHWGTRLEVSQSEQSHSLIKIILFLFLESKTEIFTCLLTDSRLLVFECPCPWPKRLPKIEDNWRGRLWWFSSHLTIETKKVNKTSTSIFCPEVALLTRIISTISDFSVTCGRGIVTELLSDLFVLCPG